jgi:hypothetical protein
MTTLDQIYGPFGHRFYVQPELPIAVMVGMVLFVTLIQLTRPPKKYAELVVVPIPWSH